ncbi:MAG: 1,4-alpha-glucan branching protein GlgB [Clostridiales bacterium]|jgi:1,4-alpha-glucan branching enzyme|nr:1,4-alpha-glucan branching protein GlgB [Clostridiales bacterium]
MISTANLNEVQQLINCAHSDPHRILGMHEITKGRNTKLVARAFVPQAKSITVTDLNDEKKTYPMERIHADGFFEVVINDRPKVFPYRLDMTGHNNSEWSALDPYSFLPQISEMDLYLFGQGTHYEIFNKLGGHLMEVDGVYGALFAVWAPNAHRVSVIGSFNSWDGRRHMMRSLGQSGVWELFVPGLAEFDRYKFEIQTHAGQLMQKSDPYGAFFELRPSTSGLLFNMNRYKWNDQSWIAERNASNPLDRPINIYEAHLGSWDRVYDDHYRFMSYVELAQKLVPYAADMGYTHIELLPVEEHPFDGSWGYQVTGYYAPTSRYGNPDEFKFFVDTCHQNGIGVILDWVPAHFPKDSHGLGRFDGSGLYEHEDPRQGEHPDWGTYIFNYGRSEVKNFLIGNAIFWVEQYHIDGLRVDAVASMLYLDYGKKDGQWIPNRYGGNENIEAVEFMKHMNSVLLGRLPGIMMIAEESTAWPGVSRPPHDNCLGFNLKWNMGWMNDFLTYISKEPIHRRYHHNLLTFSMVYAYTENFVLVLSHDEVVHGKGSLIGKMPGDLWQKFANLRLALGFMYGHPGKKLLFMGGEFGQFNEWSEARALDWFLLEYDHHRNLQRFVKDLNHLYKNDLPMWYDDFNGNGFEWIDCNDADRSLVAFMRKGPAQESGTSGGTGTSGGAGTSGGDLTIFICNFTPVPLEYHKTGVPLEGEYREVLNSDAEIYGGSGVVNPGPLFSEKVECQGQPFALPVRVPPLGISVIKPAAQLGLIPK